MKSDNAQFALSHNVRAELLSAHGAAAFDGLLQTEKSVCVKMPLGEAEKKIFPVSECDDLAQVDSPVRTDADLGGLAIVVLCYVVDLGEALHVRRQGAQIGWVDFFENRHHPVPEIVSFADIFAVGAVVSPGFSVSLHPGKDLGTAGSQERSEDA